MTDVVTFVKVRLAAERRRWTREQEALEASPRRTGRSHVLEQLCAVDARERIVRALEDAEKRLHVGRHPEDVRLEGEVTGLRRAVRLLASQWRADPEFRENWFPRRGESRSDRGE